MFSVIITLINKIENIYNKITMNITWFTGMLGDLTICAIDPVNIICNVI